VLHRARRRARQHGATASAGRYARSRIRAALKFLAWLDTRNVALVDATQNDVEQWLDGGSSSRYRLRDFLHWHMAVASAATSSSPRWGAKG